MLWFDVLLLTLINATACIVLPRLLAIMQIRRSQALESLSTSVVFPDRNQTITRFPYCMSHSSTSEQSCKFRPQFCANCSSIY